MKTHKLVLSALTLILGACGEHADTPPTEVRSETSAALIANFDAALGELPEGIAVKNGFAYVGFAPTGQIAKVELRSGNKVPFATLPKPVPNKGFMTGLSFGLNGDLYAA